MIGAERITAEASQRLVEALNAGQPPEPVVLDAHRAFAANAADLWFLAVIANPALLPHALSLSDQTLLEQINAVAATNSFFFGASDPAFDDACRAAVTKAFATRVAELESGWRR